MGEHEGAGGWGFIRGGMGMITQSIASYGRSVGMEIITDASVREVTVTDDRVTGVVTEDGREYRADTVISNASAKGLIAFSRFCCLF